MKKLMIVVVGLFLVFGVSGCFENPTAPATVYDPTPTSTETATPEGTAEPEATPTETATTTTDQWYVTMTGTKAGTFIFCYKAFDDTSAAPCSEVRPLISDTSFVWTSMTVESDDGITVWCHNTTDETLYFQVFKNGSPYGGGASAIPAGASFGQSF